MKPKPWRLGTKGLPSAGKGAAVTHHYSESDWDWKGWRETKVGECWPESVEKWPNLEEPDVGASSGAFSLQSETFTHRLRRGLSEARNADSSFPLGRILMHLAAWWWTGALGPTRWAPQGNPFETNGCIHGLGSQEEVWWCGCGLISVQLRWWDLQQWQCRQLRQPQSSYDCQLHTWVGPSPVYIHVPKHQSPLQLLRHF